MGNSSSTPSPSHPPTPGEPGSALRAKAHTAAQKRNEAYSQSQAAYRSNRKAEAKTLSEKGKRLDAEMKSLNAQAAEEIFQHHNKGRGLDEIDLHGLYVEEALRYVEAHIKKCRSAGVGRTRVITGMGNHSAGGVAKIRPAVEELARKEGIRWEVDPRNGGVIVLELGGGVGGGHGAGHGGDNGASHGGLLHRLLGKIKRWLS
ncbi:hypothetical protein HDV00_006877 [Rhizophlyctis rosea]|nr:hypothetical protein HDV00_006877 [Rhizophlyctis rosea]